jgi:N-acetylglucosaminyldiphosphoundecaprenol N-acetyl-beta-D-mannosaminyltransferase
MATQVRLMGNRVDTFTPEEALDHLVSRLEERSRARVYFINAHCLNVANSDASYRQALAQAELVLADGSGVLIGSRMLGIPVRHNLNGTDLVPRLLDRVASQRRRVFLLGGKPGVAAAAAAVLQRRYPGLDVVGVEHGYLSTDREELVLDRIRALKPDVLLVAMGVPRQELWLNEHWDELSPTLGIAVGALFDFLSGRFRRAPGWMRVLGIEWCFRLMLEPRRLWRRYLLGNTAFMIRVIADLGRSRLSARSS